MSLPTYCQYHDIVDRFYDSVRYYATNKIAMGLVPTVDKAWYAFVSVVKLDPPAEGRVVSAVKEIRIANADNFKYIQDAFAEFCHNHQIEFTDDLKETVHRIPRSAEGQSKQLLLKWQEAMKRM